MIDVALPIINGERWLFQSADQLIRNHTKRNEPIPTGGLSATAAGGARGAGGFLSHPSLSGSARFGSSSHASPANP